VAAYVRFVMDGSVLITVLTTFTKQIMRSLMMMQLYRNMLELF
jgi:hypothetical protein